MAVFKGGVAQSVTKRPEDAGDIDPGWTGGLVIGRWFVRKHHRQLAGGFWERACELSAWRAVAEQSLHNRRAAFHAWKEGLENRRAQSIGPIQRDGPAADVDDDHRLSEFRDGADEIILPAGQVQPRA